MKVRALRGVCVGVDHHLVVDDIADLDPAQVPFLVSIKAVEVLPEDDGKAVTSAKPTKKSIPTHASAKPDHKE